MIQFVVTMANINKNRFSKIQSVTLFIIASLVAVLMIVFPTKTVVNAQSTYTPNITNPGSKFIQPTSGSEDLSTCGGVEVAIDVDCDNSTENPIIVYSIAVINFLAAGVGLVVIIMIAVGGVQYMTAGGNPQKTQEAVTRIINAILGLLVFLFMYAFLQWLIPGGLF